MIVMVGAVGDLLAEVDRLPYSQRMSVLAVRARSLAAEGGLVEALAELRRGAPYERFLAVTMALVTGDRAAVTAALGDPDGYVGAAAVKGCLRAGWLGTDEVVTLVQDAPADRRRLVYRCLRGLRRPDLADVLIDVVRERYGDGEAAALLLACGASTVRRLLPELQHAVGSWSALARRHPDVLLDHAEWVLASVDGPRHRAWSTPGIAHLTQIAVHRPNRTLDLLERFAPSTYLPGELWEYGVLAALDPQRVLRLLTSPARASWLRRTPLPVALLDRLKTLLTPELVLLGTRLRGNEQAWAGLLDAVPPSRRGVLYDAVMADVDTSQQVLSDQVLRLLPYRWQERETRRILELARIRDDEAAVLTYTAYLPLTEAAPALTAATRRADAADRAAAYELLLAAARRCGDLDAVAEAVSQLRRLRNEQDPVRARALTVLSLMARQVRVDSIEPLTQIVTDATQARDASSASLSALRGLAVSVLQQHADEPALLQWALQTLDRLFGHRLPPLGRLDLRLRRGQESEVFAEIQPWIEAGMARGEYEALFAVTRALGRRAWRLPELQGLLRRTIDADLVSSVFRQAVMLWLDNPLTRAERVAEVLRIDSSTVTLIEVWQTICTRRTDLLDQVLLDRPPKGKFLAAGARWVPGPAAHVHRWLPRHQRAYVALQARIAADAGATTQARVAAIVAAARVPDAGWDVVERYLDSADTSLAEAALAALAWTNRPADALPILLSHVDDGRARVASYAASRTARFIPPARLVAVLTDIATGSGKVTSRKQALRLAVQFGSSAAMDVLESAWWQTGQHRDVRAAVVSAARLRLDLPASRGILELAASGGRVEVLTVLATPVTGVAERYRKWYGALVIGACGSSDPIVARTAWGCMPAWVRWAADATDRFVAAMSDLADHHGWSIAANAIGALLDQRMPARSGVPSSPLGAALEALVRLDVADQDPGGPARDRPARRRIDALINRAASWARFAGPEVDRVPLCEAARVLAGTPAFVPPASRLLLALIPLTASTPEELAAGLLEIATLTADRPVLASQLAELLAQRLRQLEGVWESATIIGSAAILADRTDAAAGLFAVALTRAGDRYGWTATWRDLLCQLRCHPVADVRSAAEDISMSDN